MKCEKFLSLLPMFPDAMPPEDKEDFLKHAQECEACKAQYRAHETMLLMLGSFDDEIETPPNLMERITREESGEKQQRGWGQKPKLPKQLLAMAASIIILAGTFLLREKQAPYTLPPGSSAQAPPAASMKKAGFVEDQEEEPAALPMLGTRMRNESVEEGGDAPFLQAETQEGYDAQSSLHSVKIQLQMDALEERLESIQAQIDAMQLQMDAMQQSAVAHSNAEETTIKATRDFKERVQQTVLTAWGGLSAFIENALIFLLSAVPYAASLVLIFAVVCWVVRYIKQNKIHRKRSERG